jgi:hypothetical protein
MAKKPFLTAPEIIKDKIYMVRVGQAAYEPAIFWTTEEPGYLRGHLYVDSFQTSGLGYSAKAYAKTLEGNRDIAVELHRRNEKDVWTIGHPISHPSIMDMPENWADHHINLVERQIENLQQRLQFLKSVKARIEQTDVRND